MPTYSPPVGFVGVDLSSSSHLRLVAFSRFFAASSSANIGRDVNLRPSTPRLHQGPIRMLARKLAARTAANDRSGLSGTEKSAEQQRLGQLSTALAVSETTTEPSSVLVEFDEFVLEHQRSPVLGGLGVWSGRFDERFAPAEQSPEPP
jgi:hypothetical protein